MNVHRIAWCLIAFLVLWIALGEAPAPPRDAASESETTAIVLWADGWLRTAQVHVPPPDVLQAPAPLVLNFHGFGHDGAYQEDYTGMSDKSDEEGFIVAYPDGIGHSWNAGGACCPPATVLEVDDVAFVRALLDRLSLEYDIDPDRIFATGSSNGGMLSHRLGCEAFDLFAAIAPASAYLAVETCNPPRPVPVIQTQGTADPVVPYWTAELSNKFWAQHNECAIKRLYSHTGGATCYVYEGCALDASVEFCQVRGMAHTWPNDSTIPWIDATDTFWDFFVEHPMNDWQ